MCGVSFVADGELVVAGGHGPVALEPADAAFDRVALLIAFGVERGRPRALAASAGGVLYLGQGLALNTGTGQTMAPCGRGQPGGRAGGGEWTDCRQVTPATGRGR